MAEHKHEPGTMDITDQERTFEGFVRIVSYAATVIVVLLILLYLLNG
ncbi:aa3-type cytochrome c oxidase subunit IV [Roseicyclus sp. F158]|uniref:Aa3-type cytochrome c oxidase subunit IV n=1 Tax=Tropicimonas omnivorans TaxID=3075590 RepID=A0ABU3DC94_9RHOB|nr:MULTISPECIES: aa3-type cytochrome c oxidase subunit IV [Roseobacteraceae]MDT0681318.1 aa3-type cytochrome c oxidase subunit IV [Roseicyclus sp. F158]